MKILAEKGIDIFNTDKKGNNALHISAKKGFSNVVKMLVDSKFPIDRPNNRGETALALACLKHNNESVLVLLKAGADPNYI